MNFQPSQPLFLLAILVLVVYAMRLRSLLTDRVLSLLFGAAGIAFVLRPDLSTRVANSIGVGRGADLLLYSFILFSLFRYVTMAARFRTLERQLTAAVRRLALVEQSALFRPGGEKDRP